MITMVLMSQVSSCLVGVSHTAFNGLELPSGITKNGRKEHGRSLYPSFRGDHRASSGTARKVFSVPRSGYRGDTGDSLICYFLEKEDVTL
jgi:hypothetical protein